MATSYDYTPLFRSSVGFDRLFNLLENAQRDVRPAIGRRMTLSRRVTTATASRLRSQVSPRATST